MKKHSGFTLVEIAIVLVLITLLVAAVLKGYSMVTQSRAKSVINDIKGVSAAVSMYYNTYRLVPGDDPQATRWGAGVVAGNGDRAIDGTYAAVASNPPTSEQETNLFWWHLRKSGMLSGSSDIVEGPKQPISPTGSPYGIQRMTGTQLSGMRGVVVCTEAPARIAIAIDNDLDDGKPNTGTVRAFKGVYGDPLAATAAALYTEEDGETYVICSRLGDSDVIK
jgi:prepilin-type N-terminal cleavage/methylation domain-containing protein